MFGPYGSYPYQPPTDDDPPAPPLIAAPTVEFTAPCPGCGAAVTWAQLISGSAVPRDNFTIACDCTVAAA